MSEEASASEESGGPVVRIETESLVLREITLDDVDAIHEHASDDEVVAQLRWGPNTREQTEAWLRSVVDEQDASPRLVHTLGVYVAGEDRVIGACRLEQPVRSEKAGRITAGRRGPRRRRAAPLDRRSRPWQPRLSFSAVRRQLQEK